MKNEDSLQILQLIFQPSFFVKNPDKRYSNVSKFC